MKKPTQSTILSLLIMGATLFSAVIVSAEIDQGLKNEILNATDQATLLEVIQQPGISEDDIFMKGLACRRLTVVGNADAVPTLAKLLASENEQESFFARYALEMMPFESVNPVLIDAAQNLPVKNNRLGAILSLGVKNCAEAVPVLKSIVLNPKTTCDRKAAYAALGMIATVDAADFLMECAKNTQEAEDYLVRKRLADSMLDAAQKFEEMGDLAKATQIYDAVVVPIFPVYAQKAGSYHGLLTRQGEAGPILVTKLHSPKSCCFTGGIKTIREYADADGSKIVATCLGELDKLCPERKVYVIRALGDRKDEASQKLVFPVLKKLCASPDVNVKIATIQALKKVGKLSPPETLLTFIENVPSENVANRAEILDAIVETISALPCPKVDAFLVENMKNVPLNDVALSSAFFQIVENRRISAAGPELVKIANLEGLNSSVRDRVLAALSEIVTLDNLNLLVVALNGEQDDARVSWILRAACTRMPREDCAVAVAKLYDATPSVTEKAKLLTLLKQIGGKTALASVARACFVAETADIATQTIGTWNTPDDVLEVAAVCLDLAKNATEERYQIRGIRSYIRIARQFDLPKEKKFEMCRTAFAVAKRAEDKALIFEVFRRIIEVESACEAMTYAAGNATDSAVCELAYETVVAIGKKFQGQSSEFRTILSEVVEKSQNAQTVADAKVILARLDAAEANIPFRIVSAHYGAGDKIIDVMDKIVPKFKGKALIPLSGSFNANFSDPAPGVVKRLTIVIQMKDTSEQRTLTFKEDEAIILPIE